MTKQTRRGSKQTSETKNDKFFSLVKFKSQVKASKMNRILNQKHKRVIAFQGWSIDQKYQMNNWKLLFQQIQQAKCTDLHLNQTYSPSILNEITFPKFSCLKRIYLRSNRIQNIEALCFIDIKLIQEINLETNDITNIGPVNKLCLPHLTVLKFLQNPIETSFQMDRLKCNKKYINLDLANNALECSRYQVETFSFYPKIQSQALFFKTKKNTRQIKKDWIFNRFFTQIN